MAETLKYYLAPDAKAVKVEVGKGTSAKLWTSREHTQVMAMVRKCCTNYNAEYKECMLTDGYACILETSLHPVSYTHLDVYKRQDLHWGYRFALTSGSRKLLAPRCGKGRIFFVPWQILGEKPAAIWRRCAPWKT